MGILQPFSNADRRGKPNQLRTARHSIHHIGGSTACGPARARPPDTAPALTYRYVLLKTTYDPPVKIRDTTYLYTAWLSLRPGKRFCLTAAPPASMLESTAINNQRGQCKWAYKLVEAF